MSEQTPTLAAEIETVKKIYAAINRNDVPAAIKFFDPQIERVEPPGFPSAGTYRGHAAVLEHIAKGRNTWAEGTCEPERCIPAGNKIVVFLHVRVRLKDRTNWSDARFADVCTFRDGKVTQLYSFGERQEALDWAGIKDADTR